MLMSCILRIKNDTFKGLVNFLYLIIYLSSQLILQIFPPQWRRLWYTFLIWCSNTKFLQSGTKFLNLEKPPLCAKNYKVEQILALKSMLFKKIGDMKQNGPIDHSSCLNPLNIFVADNLFEYLYLSPKIKF